MAEEVLVTDSIENAQGDAGSLLAGGKSMIEALAQMRLKLLDLTGRNRLINFKHGPGKTIQFADGDFNVAFERLTGDSPKGIVLECLPEPGPAECEIRNGRPIRPDAKIYAQQLGFSTTYDLASAPSKGIGRSRQATAALKTLYYADELGKHGRKLAREAKLAVEETGSNMLYLVFGFLEYPENPGSDKVYQAPLLCVPVSLSISDAAQYSTFTVLSSGEELTNNLSLHEKVKRDFGLNLPEYADEDGESAQAYMQRVADVVNGLPGWKIQHRITLSLLSFANMLMVTDNTPKTWENNEGISTLLVHPLIKQVFEGGSHSAGGPTYAGEYDIDTHPGADLPLIYDADSSQHSALIDVLEGKSRVIEGPPGTGKSQTITNIIAAALQSGKSVLFVAEKLAALEVVKSRLEQAGLEQFVLELHSNKTNKKRVLEDLQRRIAMKAPRLGALPARIEQLNEKKNELRDHMQALSSARGNDLGLTLHQVMWRSELNRMRCGDAAAHLTQVEYPAAVGTTPAQLLTLTDQLKYTAQHYDVIGKFDDTHPFWGFSPSGLAPQDTIPIQQALSYFSERFDLFEEALVRTLEILGSNEITLDNSSAGKLISVLSELAPADPAEVNFQLLPSLFSAQDPAGCDSLRVLRELSELALKLTELERIQNESLTGTFPVTNDEVVRAKRIADDLRQLGLNNKTGQQLAALHTQLESAVVAGAAAFTDLAAIAGLYGLQFDAKPETVTRICAIRRLLEAAPVSLLHHRSQVLGEPASLTALARIQSELQGIQALGSELDGKVYLDSIPEPEELSSAIDVLRQGNTWYRIFQGGWRKALGVHKKLARDKSKKISAPERLAELENLRQYCRRDQAWNADSNIKRLCCQSFDGGATPFTDLIRLSSWLIDARNTLEDHRVTTSAFDPVNIDRAEVISLLEASRNVPAAVAALQALMVTHEQVLSAAPDVVGRIALTMWDARISSCADTADALAGAIALLAARAKPGITLQNSVDALSQVYQAPALLDSLNLHADGRRIFGASYRGRETDLSTAFAAHTYGTLLLDAKLPRPIEHLLLSAESLTNYSAIEESIVAINQGWQDLISFESALRPYGEISVADWASADADSMAAFVKGLARRTSIALVSLSDLLPWAQYLQARETCKHTGLADYVACMESGALPSSQLIFGFSYRFYSSIAEQMFRLNKPLRVFSGTRHTAVRKDYGELDRDVIRLRGAQVARDCIRVCKPPEGTTGLRVDDKSEMALLDHLIPQQRPRVPLRKMLSRAGRAIQALKPCFMMGPQAVAQFLQPGQLHFDIVIMDEASQLKPEQALGAIARGTQLVVVGDPKQLPPTSFFARMATSDDDGDSGKAVAAVDAESILDVCISHFHPVRTLRWHYRSQHESLIAFSNQFFYRGNLVVFPSPFGKSKELGLRYQYVKDGIYEHQMNIVEARRVVEAAAAHILERPASSLGIVTLNIKQRDLIAEMLESRLKTVSGADEFRADWQARGMDLFVKNLENVQGDERDCIMISTTFGKPATAGVVRQNFGPISRSGGWRRLNVLFTRAKKSVVVFSSMQPEEIVVDKSTPEGTRALRNYLLFARDNVLSQSEETELPPDSDFEVAVLDLLRGKGYEVVPQLGVAGFRIDIAVRHPDYRSTFLAAIECDGASYHSGVSVRDRDRIRQEILEGLGWRGRIWRIWSTDWFRNPQLEAERLFSFLAELRAMPIPEGTTDFVVNDSERADETQDVLTASPADEAGTSNMVLATDDDDIEIEVGDLVTYFDTVRPDEHFRVRITGLKTDVDLGFISETTPLAQVLLGSVAGDNVVLRVPSKTPATLCILSVLRQGHPACNTSKGSGIEEFSLPSAVMDI